MANRRMFSIQIVGSDAFMEMPPSAQCLYFHLAMRADDDGFVNAPKMIQRMVGSNDDDLRLLIAKRFLLAFDSGIVVVKHWKVHNYIQTDRYKKTAYRKEMEQLSINPNRVYSLIRDMDTECIQDGYGMDTECIQVVSVGKDRLDKNRLDKNSVVEEKDTVTAYAANNLKVLTPTHMHELLSFTDDLPDDVIRHAIDKACGLDKRYWAYVKSILNAYVENGVKTVGDAKAEDDRHRQAGTKKTVTQGAHDYTERTYKEDDFVFYDPSKDYGG